ncbi:MAG: hypothetical protein FJ304_17315 [Planctomycetes bacterium]|nr:hypothetical protein [Planctomycetota bacterium]
MRCPSFGSSAVKRLPANGLSPDPGYICQECGCKMRGKGMAVIYGIAILLGVGLIALMGWMLSIGEAEQPLRAIGA